jgi:hypothetical protein
VAVVAHLVGGSATFGADCPSSREEFEQRKHGLAKARREGCGLCVLEGRCLGSCSDLEACLFEVEVSLDASSHLVADAPVVPELE